MRKLIVWFIVLSAILGVFAAIKVGLTIAFIAIWIGLVGEIICAISNFAEGKVKEGFENLLIAGLVLWVGTWFL